MFVYNNTYVAMHRSMKLIYSRVSGQYSHSIILVECIPYHGSSAAVVSGRAKVMGCVDKHHCIHHYTPTQYHVVDHWTRHSDGPV